MMLGADCKLIYGTKDYHRKRLKMLENEKYIRRVNSLYIKLDVKGTKLVKTFGYDYNNYCRTKEYIGRLNEIAKIAAITINSDIDFIASWNLKTNNIFTETSRKYIGKMNFLGMDRIVYYIANHKTNTYISQVVNDIQKIIKYDNIIIFMEDFNFINEKSKFYFGKDSTLIIKPTNKNLDIMKKLKEIDFYEIVKQIYSNKEILLSNWKRANYMTTDKRYVIVMPFLDTERLRGLNIFYRNNQKGNRKIDIITLKENKEKINEILIKNTNIIEIDNWLGGFDNGKTKN